MDIPPNPDATETFAHGEESPEAKKRQYDQEISRKFDEINHLCAEISQANYLSILRHYANIQDLYRMMKSELYAVGDDDLINSIDRECQGLEERLDAIIKAYDEGLRIGGPNKIKPISHHVSDGTRDVMLGGSFHFLGSPGLTKEEPN